VTLTPSKKQSQWVRLLLAGAVLACSVGCDQATKFVAIGQLRGTPPHSYFGDTFRFVYAENPGAFLGLGGALPGTAQFWAFVVAVGTFLFFALGYLIFNPRMTRMQTAALALLVGGGLSNWVDRLVNDGRVVDFMNLGIGSLRTGIFNVADLAILTGAALFALSSRKPKTDSPPQPGDAAA
jgi:signal peptidase II